MGDQLESEIRRHFDAGDLAGAARIAVEGYGPEVLGYLVALMSNPSDATDAFSQLSEDLWRGLPKFEWRSTFRTWMYVLARHAAARTKRAAADEPGRKIPLSQISEVAAAVASQTMPHLRSSVKSRFAELRDELPPDDRTLLILRIDRNLSWNEVAQVLSDEEISEAELSRDAAKLRKRFQVVKEKLTERAREVGLLDEVD